MGRRSGGKPALCLPKMCSLASEHGIIAERLRIVCVAEFWSDGAERCFPDQTRLSGAKRTFHSMKQFASSPVADC